MMETIIILTMLFCCVTNLTNYVILCGFILIHLTLIRCSMILHEEVKRKRVVVFKRKKERESD